MNALRFQHCQITAMDMIAIVRFPVQGSVDRWLSAFGGN